MRNNLKEEKRKLVYTVLSSENTVRNSIHASIIQRLRPEFSEIIIICYGERYQKTEGNITYISGKYRDWLRAIPDIKELSLIYSNDYFLGGLMGVLLKKIKKVPLFIRIGSPWKYELTSPLALAKSIAVKIIRPLIIRNSDYVIYNSKAVVQQRVPHRYRVIYNGIDTTLFKPLEIERIDPKKLNVVYIGNLNLEKGLEYLFEATKGLTEKITLSIVGDGPLRKELTQKYPYAHFYGRIPQKEIPRTINQHDLLVLPTLVESFPNVLLEAMACGKPIIATNIYGIPEIVKDQQEGFLIKPKDSKELKEKIEDIMNHPEQARKMGLRGIETARLYDSKKQVEEMYQALLAIKT
ncbi:glycosyltransferase family 4 protein [Candidatus Woesearchaeota archaeon]|nr:glycosyltransferase family 4 protein [Candidatus Woesearchaeota archaeon]